jgi:hypothetical protein
MKYLLSSTCAALALISPALAMGDGVVRITRESILERSAAQRRLPAKKGTSKGGSKTATASVPSAPRTCCEFVTRLMALDQQCSKALARLETSIACQNNFGIITTDRPATPFDEYSSAVAAYYEYFFDYQLGAFPLISGLDCSVDSTGTVDLALVTYGGWCLIDETVFVDSVYPPSFTYVALETPVFVSEILGVATTV